jgi:hypothetical protein
LGTGALFDKKARSLNKVLRADLRKTSKQAKYAKRLAKAKAQGTFKDGVKTYKKGLFGRTTTIDASGKAIKKNIFKRGYTRLTKSLRRNDGSMKSFKKGFLKHAGIIKYRKDGTKRYLFNKWPSKNGKKNLENKYLFYLIKYCNG